MDRKLLLKAWSGLVTAYNSWLQFFNESDMRMYHTRETGNVRILTSSNLVLNNAEWAVPDPSIEECGSGTRLKLNPRLLTNQIRYDQRDRYSRSNPS